jgi:hypothetical protein
VDALAQRKDSSVQDHWQIWQIQPINADSGKEMLLNLPDLLDRRESAFSFLPRSLPGVRPRMAVLTGESP